MIFFTLSVGGKRNLENAAGCPVEEDTVWGRYGTELMRIALAFSSPHDCIMVSVTDRLASHAQS